MGAPRAVGIFRLSGNDEMSNVTNAGKGFTSEAISPYIAEVLKLLEFGGSESLAENGEIFFLLSVSSLIMVKTLDGS